MKTILLIEDDPSVQDAMQFLGEVYNLHLIICSDPKEVLSENSFIPSIYLIDKQLSGLDGLELCHVLKTNERTKDVPIIMISAAPNIVELAQKAGADWGIRKPFQVSFLIKKINQLLALTVA